MSTESVQHKSAVGLQTLCAELDARIRGGEDVRCEEYFEQYPHFSQEADLALELIYTEYVAREQAGETQNDQNWLARFPQWSTQLARQFELHEYFSEVVEGELPEEEVSSNTVTLPQRFGHYELLEQIGRGGMGVVYKALDTRLERVVAIKLLCGGIHAGVKEALRFRFEAEVAAKFAHPNIVPIHEMGERADQLFFSLEYLEGGSLADEANQAYTPPAAAALVRDIALAVQYAHQNGIVHRDLKPANILLDADGTPKIADFGLAKNLLASQNRTTTGAIIGTPSYMSPEQATGQVNLVGTLSDVYSLGAVLYFLLTRSAPFGDEPSIETLIRVAREEPAAPRRLNPSIPRDLETICLKCLEKEPDKRYASAKELANELERFLAGRSIRARRPSMPEVVYRWSRRRPAVAALAVVSTVAMLALLIGSLWYSSQLAEAYDQLNAAHQLVADKNVELTAQLDLSRRGLYASQLNQVQEVADQEPTRTLEMLLDPQRCPPELREFTWRYWYRRCNRSAFRLSGHEGPIHCAAYSSSGRLIATGGEDHTIRIWDAEHGTLQATLHAPARVTSVAFMTPPNGRPAIASALSGRRVIIWDLQREKPMRRLKGFRGWITSLAVSPDNMLLGCTSQDGYVRLWDASNWKLVSETHAHDSGAAALAFARERPLLATTGHDCQVRLWKLPAMQPVGKAPLPAGGISVAFSPDGTRLGAGTGQSAFVLWKLTDSNPPQFAQRQQIAAHTGGVRALDYSPRDGAPITVGGDGCLTVWNSQPLAARMTLAQHPFSLRNLALSPDGKRCVCVGGDEAAYGWELAAPKQATPLDVALADADDVFPTPDGKQLVIVSGESAAIEVWDLEQKQRLRTLGRNKSAVRALAYSPRGRHFAISRTSGRIEIWDLARPGVHCEFHGELGRPVTAIAYSPTQPILASGGQDGTITLWNTQTYQSIAAMNGHKGHVNAIAFTPDGERLVSAGNDRRAVLWDFASRKPLHDYRGSHICICVAVDPSGQFVAVGDRGPTVHVLRTADWQVQTTISGFINWVTSLAFSPDGKTLAAGSGSDQYKEIGEVKLCDPVTGQAWSTLNDSAAPVFFSSDGCSLFVRQPHSMVELRADPVPPSPPFPSRE